MNKNRISYTIGILLLSEAVLMLLPTLVAVYYKEAAVYSFLITIAALALVGGLLFSIKPKNKIIYAKDGFIIVSLGWILISLFGAAPFTLSGNIPNFLDAVFEAVSGFTTTGASILADVESLDRSILFWRSFTHWVGGMGALVFIMAVLPLSGGAGNLNLMKAESPGPDVGKLVPKSNSTARILYAIYFSLTVLQIICLLCSGMSLFESITLSFGTAGTGGFGIRNSSIAEYSISSQIIIGIFMTLFGINFNAYYFIICGKIKDAFKFEEVKAYLGIIISAIVLITLNIYRSFNNIFEAVHAVAFQVSSVITTTGYSTVDFNKWPEFSKLIMLTIMCIGACAGSTGGGLKVSRLIILRKNAAREIKKLTHPRRVNVVTIDGKKISDDVIKSTNVYFFIYIMIFVVSFLLVSLDNLDFTTNISAVVATFNNIGPGLGAVGATGNYGIYSWTSKLVFIADMLLGRLEIFPFIMLFMPTRFGLKKIKNN